MHISCRDYRRGIAMIDTQELGAGTYPSAPEKKEYKCYRFKADISIKGEGYVYAKNEEEAKKLIYLGSWDELERKSIENVEEIEEINEMDS